MAYGVPRPAKLKKEVIAKKIGSGGKTVVQKVGTKCKVQRTSDPGSFALFFAKDEVLRIDAKDIPETIEYTDKKPVDWQ